MTVEWEETNWPGMIRAYLPGLCLEIKTIIDDEDDDGLIYHCRIGRTKGQKGVIYFSVNCEGLESAKAELENESVKLV